MTAPPTVRDARPPVLLVRALNPVMRMMLRTPLGRFVRPLALLEFDGRRSGRHYRVPVGWHEIDNGPVVVTPARWRVNFRGGLPVTVRFRGRRREFTGTLDADPRRVAEALQSVADRRGSLRALGIDLPGGHQISAADVVTLDRALIRFTARVLGADQDGLA